MTGLTTAAPATTLFTYGTLLDPDVRRLVMGERWALPHYRPGRLTGWRRCRVRGSMYPLLVAARGHAVDGMVLEGVEAEAAARIAYFESHEYLPRLAPVRCLATGHAITSWVFLPSAGTPVDHRDWRYDAWVRRHKRAFLRLVRYWMNLYGATGPGLAHPHLIRGGRPLARRGVRDDLG